MAFNPKVFLFKGHPDVIDYTPGGAVSSGDVVVINGVPYFATVDIAASVQGALAARAGIWKGNKVTGAIAVGDAIYWNATGNPVVGTAGTGAFNNVGTGQFVGYATAASLSGDQYVYFLKEV